MKGFVRVGFQKKRRVVEQSGQEGRLFGVGSLSSDADGCDDGGD